MPTPTVPAAREDTAAILERLGGFPCPESAFTCVTLTVPLDHFNPTMAGTIPVVFAVQPATGARKGMFVTVTGGPGTSGLAAADSYTAAFDPRLTESFDIVFFDQRGVAASGGLQCADAAAAFYRSDYQAQTPAQEAALIGAAETFSQDCVAEMDAPKMLPYLGTSQAVEDLEIFRQAMEDDKLWLYGESYGTQYAQTYAAAHPEHLAGLILDGTVDLTLSGPGFMREQAQAFNDTLVATLQACNADPACAADFGGDAVAAYDDLEARLAQGPLPFNFPLPSGGKESRILTLSDMEAAVADYLYSESARMLLQRGLAAAARGDLVPLARMLYDALGLDPETLQAIPDPSWSDAIYYGVTCNDYAYFTGTAAARAEQYIRAGDAADASIPHLSSIFYGDLPCTFWPTRPEATRPAPLVATGIPTFVLGATADPATPVGNGEQVYGRLADGYLITTEGGAHVTFGWGNACPDDIVTTFLVEDMVPRQRETRCAGVVADAYVPLAPADARDFVDPLEALAAADDEIYYLPEYYYWDLETPTQVGCPYGGTLAFEPTDAGDSFTLDGCAFSAGFVMTGTGMYDPNIDRTTFDVAVSGLAAGTLSYVRESDGTVRLTGTYAGNPVELER
jgi:pimeloyl-ACP methyl ester carboxylesterase